MVHLYNHLSLGVGNEIAKPSLSNLRFPPRLFDDDGGLLLYELKLSPLNAVSFLSTYKLTERIFYTLAQR